MTLAGDRVGLWVRCTFCISYTTVTLLLIKIHSSLLGAGCLSFEGEPRTRPLRAELRGAYSSGNRLVRGDKP